MSVKSTILIIEDEKDLSQLIAYNLESEGFRTKISNDGEEGYRKATKESPDLIILDLMLPKLSGIEVCKLIRANSASQKIPILMLTAKSEEIDRVIGFEVGADDYITKPFSPRELVLRVKAILKRSISSSIKKEDILKKNLLEVDFSKHRVWVSKQEITLTATEFKLLEYLLKSQGRVLTRDLLLDKVWGYDASVTTRTVDTHVKRLREKLGEAGELVETVRGVGYRLKDA